MKNKEYDRARKEIIKIASDRLEPTRKNSSLLLEIKNLGYQIDLVMKLLPKRNKDSVELKDELDLVKDKIGFYRLALLIEQRFPNGL